ncbi:diacylglycerol kinase alpha [Mycteria americana]|uniref:diacylglycerol kinase alpha n=1 Tax=Mycteria americana TaxID=33587 RepID=UPI003F5886E8
MATPGRGREARPCPRSGPLAVAAAASTRERLRDGNPQTATAAPDRTPRCRRGGGSPAAPQRRGHGGVGHTGEGDTGEGGHTGEGDTRGDPTLSAREGPGQPPGGVGGPTPRPTRGGCGTRPHGAGRGGGGGGFVRLGSWRGGNRLPPTQPPRGISKRGGGGGGGPSRSAPRPGGCVGKRGWACTGPPGRAGLRAARPVPPRRRRGPCPCSPPPPPRLSPAARAAGAAPAPPGRDVTGPGREQPPRDPAEPWVSPVSQPWRRARTGPPSAPRSLPSCRSTWTGAHACARAAAAWPAPLSPDSGRKVQDVLQDFDSGGALSRHRQGECVDFEGFTLFLRSYLEADDIPEPLCRNLFASFQSGAAAPPGSRAGSDLVCINDVSCYFSLLEGGRPEDKLEFTFKLYDKDGNGLLDSSVSSGEGGLRPGPPPPRADPLPAGGGSDHHPDDAGGPVPGLGRHRAEADPAGDDAGDRLRRQRDGVAGRVAPRGGHQHPAAGAAGPGGAHEGRRAAHVAPEALQPPRVLQRVRDAAGGAAQAGAVLHLLQVHGPRALRPAGPPPAASAPTPSPARRAGVSGRPSACPSVCPSTCLSVRPPVRPSACLLLHPPVHPPSHSPSASRLVPRPGPSAPLPSRPSVCAFVRPSVHPPHPPPPTPAPTEGGTQCPSPPDPRRGGDAGGGGGRAQVQAHVWVKGGCEAGKCGKCQKKIKSFQSLTGLHCVWCHLKERQDSQRDGSGTPGGGDAAGLHHPPRARRCGSAPCPTPTRSSSSSTPRAEGSRGRGCCGSSSTCSTPGRFITCSREDPPPGSISSGTCQIFASWCAAGTAPWDGSWMPSIKPTCPAGPPWPCCPWGRATTWPAACAGGEATPGRTW